MSAKVSKPHAPSWNTVLLCLRSQGIPTCLMLPRSDFGSLFCQAVSCRYVLQTKSKCSLLSGLEPLSPSLPLYPTHPFFSTLTSAALRRKTITGDTRVSLHSWRIKVHKHLSKYLKVGGLWGRIRKEIKILYLCCTQVTILPGLVGMGQ